MEISYWISSSPRWHSSPNLIDFSKENKMHMPNIILKLQNDAIPRRHKFLEVCQCFTWTLLVLLCFTSQCFGYAMDFQGFVKGADGT